MAINVNTVYTTVLNILNKEQRGYLTPYEFNQIATQVQLEIFEKFFDDYNQYIRMPKTDVEFASRMDHVHEEFQVFEKTASASNDPAATSNIYNQPTDLHRFGSANYNKGKNSPEIEIVSAREYTQQSLSPLTKPSSSFPIAKYKEDKLTVYPTINSVYSNSDVSFNYIRKPKDPRWGYSINNQGGYVYDSSKLSGLGANLNIISSVTQNATGITDATYGGTVGSTTGVTTNGDGSGLALQIVVSGGAVTNVNVGAIGTTGQGFKPGDTITITSALLTNASQDVVITIVENDMYVGTRFSQDFEISESQQTETILKILQYTGIVIRDPQIIQAAAQELQQEEVNSKR